MLADATENDRDFLGTGPDEPAGIRVGLLALPSVWTDAISGDRLVTVCARIRAGRTSL